MARGGRSDVGARVLCVFLESPHEDAAVPDRWRRLARSVCTLGVASAAIVLETGATEQGWLASELGVPVVALGAPQLGRARGLLWALLMPWRGWPPTRTDVARARAALDQHLRGEPDPDLVWCAGAEAFFAVPKRLRGRAVVDHVDLPSRNRRELARVAGHRLKRRLTHEGGVDASILGLVREVRGGFSSRWVEAAVERRAAAVTVASPSEVPAGGHCVRTGVVDPGIVPALPHDEAAARFVFPGSFLYPPHQDAAEWFALYVLPPLRRLLPTCHVVFAGEHPDWMPGFGELHGIEVTTAALDTVVDARSVVIAPIRSGSGTVIEVVDAWARGVPVVSTSRGIEGLQATDEQDVLVADDPAEFAARCSMAARYPELRATLAGNGRARYEAEFTWAGISAELVEWLRTLLPPR